jgi:hypothetical protein
MDGKEGNPLCKIQRDKPMVLNVPNNIAYYFAAHKLTLTCIGLNRSYFSQFINGFTIL